MILLDKFFIMQSQKYSRVCKLVPSCSSVISFERYVLKSSENKLDLFQKIRSCKLNDHKIRFNVWRLEMNVLSINSSVEEKIQQLKQTRIRYKQKYDEAYKGVVSGGKGKEAVIPKNPLMKAMIKPEKVQTNSDEFLRSQIKKDVERTYQELQFFQNQSILKLLNTILFVWCKHNPEVSYKQGMNEVLASIIYVYFMEVYKEYSKPEGWGQASEELKETFQLFNSLEYADSDIYHVFERIMDIQHEMYSEETESSLKGNINPNSKNNTPILQRIINLTDHKLKTLDLQLFRIIKLQEVKTKTFLLKWIRCMHTRQFTLQCSFVIWDSIFLDYHEWPGSKEKSQFQFIDAMCLAMFIYMRNIVLTRQTSYEILSTYQKFPQLKLGGYLQELITIAWSVCEALRNPNVIQSDWYGSQSTQNNKKLEFLKSRENKKNIEKPSEILSPKIQVKKEKQFPKSPNSLFQNKKPIEKGIVVGEKIHEKPQTKLLQEKTRESPIFFTKKESNNLFPKKQSYQNSNNNEIKVVEVKTQEVSEIKNDFPIVLAANQWKEMQELLKKALKNEDWEKNCQRTLQLLEANIFLARKKQNS